MDFDYDPYWRGKDTPFDGFLGLPDVQGRQICERLIPVLEPFEERQRRRRHVDEVSLRRCLQLVVANCVRASENLRGGWTHYSRTTSLYRAGNVYSPPGVSSGTLLNALELLDRAGLVEHRFGARPSRQSTFCPTEVLTAILAELEITPHCITRYHDQAPALVLRGVDRSTLNYDPRAPAIAGLVEEVRAFSTFIRRQAITIDLTPDEIGAINGRPTRDGAPRTPLDLKRIDLRRIFNDGDWRLGGRLFGGWWQDIPAELRERITINGLPTTELDYSGFVARAIYHHEGIEYEDDPYDVPEIRDAGERQGLDWHSEVRPTVKVMFNALINSSADTNVHYVRIPSLPRGLSRRDAYRFLRTHHERIEHRFQTRFGLSLMWRESNICMKILTESTLRNEPVLPIFDSFIAPAENLENLSSYMNWFYIEEFGFNPVIH